MTETLNLKVFQHQYDGKLIQLDFVQNITVTKQDGVLTGSISCIVTGRVDSIKEYIWDIIKLPISAIATDAFGNEMVVLPEKTLVSTGHHCEVGLDNQFIEIVVYFMERSVVTAVYDEEFTDVMEEIYLDE